MNYRNGGIKFTDPKILPAAWNSGGKSILKQDWRIEYRFYDPAYHDKYPKWKRVRVKGGMNEEKDLSIRRELAKQILKNELDLLFNQGYNPISNTINPPKQEGPRAPLYPEMPFIDAISAAIRLKDSGKSLKEALISVERWTIAAIKNLDMQSKQIQQVKRGDVRIILDEIGRMKKSKWTANNFNFYRAHLSIIWGIFNEYEIFEYDLTKIKKKPVLRTIRATLTKEQRKAIDQHLRTHHYRYWLLVNIFFHSGSRKTELCSLKAKDIDLERRVYRATVKKGRVAREVERPIKDVSVYFWQQALVGCGKDQYVFGKGYVPNEKPLLPERITRHWKEIVKDGMGIDVDFYALKHLNTDEVSSVLSLEDAARLNGHTSTRMVAEHYAVGHKDRQMDRIRKVENTFGEGLKVEAD